MKNFNKGVIFGFSGFWIMYFIFMLFVNTILWFCTDESEMLYQPVWNIFKLM